MRFEDFQFVPRLRACPACESEDIGYAFNSLDDDWSIGGFSIDQCRSCQSHFVNPQPDGESLRAFYEYLLEKNPRYVAASLNYYKNPSRRAEQKAHYLDPLLKFVTGGRLLDFGAGAGWFMRMAEDVGFVVEGIDYLDAAVVAGRTELGLTELRRGNEEAITSEPVYDVIVSNANIEHLIDPLSFARRASLSLISHCRHIDVPTPAAILLLHYDAIPYNLLQRCWHASHAKHGGLLGCRLRTGTGKRDVGPRICVPTRFASALQGMAASGGVCPIRYHARWPN